MYKFSTVLTPRRFLDEPHWNKATNYMQKLATQDHEDIELQASIKSWLKQERILDLSTNTCPTPFYPALIKSTILETLKQV